MSTKQKCPDCGTEVVVVTESTWTDLVCAKCNKQLQYEDTVETEYIGHIDRVSDFQIKQ